MLCQTASVKPHTASSGTGIGSAGGPSIATGDGGLGEGPRGEAPGLRPSGGLGADPTDEVDRLARAAEGATAQVGVLAAVAEDAAPPLLGVGLVGGGAAVGLVERALADHGADGDVG